MAMHGLIIHMSLNGWEFGNGDQLQKGTCPEKVMKSVVRPFCNRSILLILSILGFEMTLTAHCNGEDDLLACCVLPAGFQTDKYCAESQTTWGFFGHQLINKMAVFTLPESELFAFYKRHLTWIEEHAVDPDKRRYAFKEEAPRHFIDLDRYGAWPHDTLPRKWEDAVALFGEEQVVANGIAPWHIERTMVMLTKAFRDGNLKTILRHSTDLGHYVGDMHVPLHSTENYNGGMTGQHGIHGFWESRLPELYADQYDYLTGTATYLSDVPAVIWRAALASSAAVDSVLRIERELGLATKADARYTYEERGAAVIRVYSRDYSFHYHQELNGMVERRMMASIRIVGSCWYSAWVDAGKPALPEGLLNPPDGVERMLQGVVDRAFSRGQIEGPEHENYGQEMKEAEPAP